MLVYLLQGKRKVPSFPKIRRAIPSGRAFIRQIVRSNLQMRLEERPDKTLDVRLITNEGCFSSRPNVGFESWSLARLRGGFAPYLFDRCFIAMTRLRGRRKFTWKCALLQAFGDGDGKQKEGRQYTGYGYIEISHFQE